MLDSLAAVVALQARRAGIDVAHFEFTLPLVGRVGRGSGPSKVSEFEYANPTRMRSGYPATPPLGTEKNRYWQYKLATHKGPFSQKD